MEYRQINLKNASIYTFFSEYLNLKTRIDKIQNLFAGLKHLFASIQTKSNLYLQLENSTLTNEEDFLINQYHGYWLEASNQYVIKSEAFLKDMLDIEQDFQSFGRVHSLVQSMSSSRFQALLNSQCGIPNNLSTVSLINCNFLWVARMSTSLALVMKSCLCESLHSLTQNMPDIGNVQL